MRTLGTDVGRRDVQSGEVAAWLLVLGAIASLRELQIGGSRLAWIFGISMVALGARYIVLEPRGCGTWLVETVLTASGMVHVALARAGVGRVTLVPENVVAAVGRLTAATGHCSHDRLHGLDTRAAKATPSGNADCYAHGAAVLDEIERSCDAARSNSMS